MINLASSVLEWEGDVDPMLSIGLDVESAVGCGVDTSGSTISVLEART